MFSPFQLFKGRKNETVVRGGTADIGGRYTGIGPIRGRSIAMGAASAKRGIAKLYGDNNRGFR